MLISNEQNGELMMLAANYDLWDKLIVPLVGILITGYITIYINWRDKKEKKALEEKQERQKAIERKHREQLDKILEQQNIIDELNKTLWRWRYLAKKVPYYAATNKERFQIAVQDYQDQIWDILATVKILGTRADNLFQGKFNPLFKDIYAFITYTIDIKIETLIQSEGKDGFMDLAKELSQYFTDKISTELTDKIENMVKLVYSEKQ